MYISNLTHFLNENGIIPKQMPKEARELASFLTLVVDYTTEHSGVVLNAINLRCFTDHCKGIIESELINSGTEIHWICPKCRNEGIISEWQGSRWDNR